MMKATVLTTCALLLIGVGLGALTTRSDRVTAQSVKIEPGKKNDAEARNAHPNAAQTKCE